MALLVLLNKPFGVLCQFTDDSGRPTLASCIQQPGIYPAGRLDFDSEGLVLLTNSGSLQHRIAHPCEKWPKTYWVQVEGVITPEALQQLQQGVQLKDGKTLPAQAQFMAEPALWPRHPPIRERKHIPTSWLALTLTEGKNRQVRRMTAAVGFPTLRLVRVQIGPYALEGLNPGEWRSLAVAEPAAPTHRPRAGAKPQQQKPFGRKR